MDAGHDVRVLRLSTKAATIDSATTPATARAASTIERIVLGSRSPRRRELLQLIVPADRIVVRPPRQSDEAGFADLSDWQAIRERLSRIVRTKLNDVLAQHSTVERQQTLFLVADTVIVVERPAATAGDPSGRGAPDFEVLGQPPDGPDWATTVDAWFRERLAGRTHWAITGLEWLAPGERSLSSQTVTAVQFRAGLDALLPHYLGTGESRGKAGGYAIQGLGSIFVERIDGSLTNVVGLPLERVLADLVSLGATHLLPASH